MRCHTALFSLLIFHSKLGCCKNDFYWIISVLLKSYSLMKDVILLVTVLSILIWHIKSIVMYLCLWIPCLEQMHSSNRCRITSRVCRCQVECNGDHSVQNISSRVFIRIYDACIEVCCLRISLEYQNVYQFMLMKYTNGLPQVYFDIIMQWMTSGLLVCS